MESETTEGNGSELEAKVAENTEDRQTGDRIAEERGTASKYSPKKNAKSDKNGDAEEIEMLERWYSLKSGKSNNSSRKKNSDSNSDQNESKRQYEINLLESMLALSSAGSENSSEGEDSPHGSLGFVFHKYEKTGVTEYLIEQPQLGKHDAGKIKLIGGHRKVMESHDEAIRRETWEEVSLPAAKILLSGDFAYHTTMMDSVNGETLQTAIYKREIKSDAEWEIVKAAYGTHDAGNLRTFTDRALLNMDNQYFAYGDKWAKMFKDFVMETSGLDQIVSKSFKPSVSKHSLQTLNYSLGYGNYNSFKPF